jgi:Sulfotransferase family
MSDGGHSIVDTVPIAMFICAAGHSGSTLLDLLLGSHPAAMSLGEITHLPKNVALNTPCTCGVPVRDCSFWRRVLERLADEPAFGNWREDPYRLFVGLFEASNVVDRRHQTLLRKIMRKLVYIGAYLHWRSRPFNPFAPFTEPLRRGALNKRVLFRVVAEIADKPLLIDSSKHYLEAVTLYRTAPAHTRVLLLVRDGRAVFYAYLKRGYQRHRALNAWRSTYALGMPLLRKHVAERDLIEVRYEDLVRDPQAELQRVCTAIGTSFDAGMLDFQARTHHVLNGNNMRFARDGVIRLDDEWRRKLSAEDLRYFESRAGDLNRALGYC